MNLRFVRAAAVDDAHYIVPDLEPGWMLGYMSDGIRALEEFLAKHAAFDAFLAAREG